MLLKRMIVSLKDTIIRLLKIILGELKELIACLDIIFLDCTEKLSTTQRNIFNSRKLYTCFVLSGTIVLKKSQN